MLLFGFVLFVLLVSVRFSFVSFDFHQFQTHVDVHVYFLLMAYVSYLFVWFCLYELYLLLLLIRQSSSQKCSGLEGWGVGEGVE